jgi:hypothetical protein
LAAVLPVLADPLDPIWVALDAAATASATAAAIAASAAAAAAAAYVAATALVNVYKGTENQNAYIHPLIALTDNSNSIYCGPRTYTLGGAGSPLPAWLTFDSITGTLSVMTADDTMVNYSPGHAVTLTACLEYYPTVCSTAVPFTITINEC